MHDNLFNAHMTVCLLLCAVLRLSNLQITLALCLLLNSCTIEYLLLHEIFYVCGRLIIFHLIISLFYLLYHNITSWTCPKITSVLLFITCFNSLKLNFVCILKNSGLAETWRTGPSATASTAWLHYSCSKCYQGK